MGNNNTYRHRNDQYNAAQYEKWEDRYGDALEIEKQAREVYNDMIEGL